MALKPIFVTSVRRSAIAQSQDLCSSCADRLILYTSPALRPAFITWHLRMQHCPGNTNATRERYDPQKNRNTAVETAPESESGSIP